MEAAQVIKSTCALCSAGCAVLVHLVDDKVVKVKGDPNGIVNKGKLCVKGLASLEFLNHSDRLKHPLKRVGRKGDGEWQQITWDEALDIVASKLSEAGDKYGAESVAFIHGAARGYQDTCLERFANAFDSPNIFSQSHVCFVAKAYASTVTCGFLPSPDYDYPPRCIVIWGLDLSKTRPFEHKQLLQSLNRGIKLIVINPVRIKSAEKADLWIQLRPGTDLALSLGMINVIIKEDLQDIGFVDRWTVGFDRLKAHVSAYTPEKVEGITWVPAETIRTLARLYAANKPACIREGNGVEQNVNSFQTNRAIAILKAITGNLGTPGGELEWSNPSLLGQQFAPEITLRGMMSDNQWKKRLSEDQNLIPMFYYVPPTRLVSAILERKPYPIRAAYIQGCNPLATYANAQRAYEAFMKIDFLAVAHMFMTPTASLADIVLPVATYLEFDNIVKPPFSPIAQAQQKVTEVEECWSDNKILLNLAKRMGLSKHFWDEEEQYLDAVLKPAGITFKELKQMGAITGTKHYRKHEREGFKTPSGKVELYSSQLEEWGFDPLPVYRELPETPYSNPELTEEYPLILVSWKSAFHRHSDNRQIPSLRYKHPEPFVYIHPETAEKLDINDGDWMYIETKRGRIKQKAVISDIVDPRVIGADYAWWFPEQGPSNLYGWTESNINILTSDQPPYNREIGSTNLRGILCKIYKVT